MNAAALQTFLADHEVEAPQFAPVVRARISHVNGVALNEYEFRDRRTERELRDDLKHHVGCDAGSRQ